MLVTQDAMPSIGQAYKRTQREVFGTKVWVPKNDWSKLRALEKRLRRLGIDSYDFALGVSVLLEKWAAGKNLGSIPVRVLCGDWAFKKYQKNVRFMVFDKDHDDFALILECELQLAREFIMRNVLGEDVPWYQVVEDNRAFLPQEYLDMDDGTADKVIDASMHVFEAEYGVRSDLDYNDVIEKLRSNGV